MIAVEFRRRASVAFVAVLAVEVAATACSTEVSPSAAGETAPSRTLPAAHAHCRVHRPVQRHRPRGRVADWHLELNHRSSPVVASKSAVRKCFSGSASVACRRVMVGAALPEEPSGGIPEPGLRRMLPVATESPYRDVHEE